MATWQDWANKYRFLETNDQGWSTYDTALERLLGAQPGRWRRQGQPNNTLIEWRDDAGNWVNRSGGGGEYNPFWLAQHGGSIAWDDPNLLLYKSGLVSMDDVRAYKQSLGGGSSQAQAPMGSADAFSSMMMAQQAQAQPGQVRQPSMRSAMMTQLAPSAPRAPGRNQLGFLRSLGGRGY